MAAGAARVCAAGGALCARCEERGPGRAALHCQRVRSALCCLLSAGCASRDWHVQLAAPACPSLGKLLCANGKVKTTPWQAGRSACYGAGGALGGGTVLCLLQRGLLLPFSCLRHCPTCFLTTNSAEPYFPPPTALYKQQNPGSPDLCTALPVQEVNSRAPNSNNPPAHLLPG